MYIFDNQADIILHVYLGLMFLVSPQWWEQSIYGIFDGCITCLHHSAGGAKGYKPLLVRVKEGATFQQRRYPKVLLGHGWVLVAPVGENVVDVLYMGH